MHDNFYTAGVVLRLRRRYLYHSVIVSHDLICCSCLNLLQLASGQICISLTGYGGDVLDRQRLCMSTAFLSLICLASVYCLLSLLDDSARLQHRANLHFPHKIELPLNMFPFLCMNGLGRLNKNSLQRSHHLQVY